MFFSVITKNLNWEIETKNLVTFKNWDKVNDEKFKYYGGSLKNPTFIKNQYIRGGGVGMDCLKRGAWAVCRFKRGLGKKEGVMFLRLIPQCTL